MLFPNKSCIFVARLYKQTGVSRFVFPSQNNIEHEEYRKPRKFLRTTVWLVAKRFGIGARPLQCFDLSPLVDKEHSTIPYKRRDFYKITLLYGKGVVLNYADKTVEIDGYALVFSNPLIPYSWEGLEHIEFGHYCIFNQAFFHRFGQLSDYPVYQLEESTYFHSMKYCITKRKAFSCA